MDLERAYETRNLEELERMYLKNPDNFYVKFKYAKVLALNRKNKKANILFKELLDTPLYFSASFELCKIQIKSNDLHTAKAYLQNLHQINPEDKYVLYELGNVEYKLKNYGKARKYYLGYLKYDNYDSRCLNALMNIELTLDNEDKAMEYFEKLEDKDKKYALFTLGKYKLSKGNIEEAKRIFEKQLEYSKDDVFTLFELANIDYKDKKVEETEEKLKYILSIKNDPFALNNLTILYIKQGRLDEAFKLVKRMLENDIRVNNRITVYLTYMLNVFFKEIEYDKIRNYAVMQIIDYDEYAAVEKIIQTSKNLTIKFDSSIDIYKLYNDIKKYITEENKLSILSFMDVYMVPYKGIGGEGVDYCKVSVIPNTKNIIALHPIKSIEDLEYEEEREKQKRF